MQAHAIINRKSGGLADGSANALEKLIAERFKAANTPVSVKQIDPDDLDEVISKAIKSGSDTIIVAGGDGTIRTAASALAGTDKILGIIPTGTFNRLAREIGMPLDQGQAVDILLKTRAKKIDVARLNGALFLCNSLIGLPPRFSEQRQELRDEPFGARMAGYWQVIGTIFRARKRLALTIDAEGETRKMRVLSLAISNNPYNEEPGLGLVRPRMDRGVLGIYISKHRSGLKMLWVFFRAILGSWRGDPALEITTARKVTIDSNRKALLVSNDGEVERPKPPLKYEIEPKALSLLVPTPRQRNAS